VARTSDPHAATLKAWETRARAADGGTAVQQRGDFAPAPPADWNTKYEDGFAKGMTKGEVVLDWLRRNKIAKRGDKFVMYHATPANTTHMEIRAGSYLTDDKATAAQQASRDRGSKAGRMRVHEVEFYPWEVTTGSTWATAATTLKLGKEV